MTTPAFVSNSSSSSTMTTELSEGMAELSLLKSNVDSFFVLVIAMHIFFMQCGFAFLEAGSVRTKNTVNILIKNMLDALIGGLAYWAVGWAVAYGPNGNAFIGGSHFFGKDMEEALYPSWVFQFVFAATAATIVSGSIAERCQFSAYFLYSIVITGWVYPMVSHWCWDSATPGFLNVLGFADFAGSGVVHLTGGVCALVACLVMGARNGRFDAFANPVSIPGHSVPLAALGGFILIFGFLAFNGGSQASIANKGDAEIVAKAIVNTIMGGCSSGLTVLFINRGLVDKYWSYLLTLNGTLTGMVSLCAGCDVYPPWASLLIGVMAAVAFLICRAAMIRFGLDDPLDAVSVHGAGGIVGLMAVGLFSQDEGLLLGKDEGVQRLWVNFLGMLCILGWSGLWSLLIFVPMRLMGRLRISAEDEFRGMDLIKHGEAAYPADAWVELQYNHENMCTPQLQSGPTANKLAGKQAEYNDEMRILKGQKRLFTINKTITPVESIVRNENLNNN